MENNQGVYEPLSKLVDGGDPEDVSCGRLEFGDVRLFGFALRHFHKSPVDVPFNDVVVDVRSIVVSSQPPDE